MTWYNDVYVAITKLQGQAHLSEIYDEVYRQRESRNDPLGENYKEWIRYTLQHNSRGKGHDLFEPVQLGRGIWRIKHRQ